jgi:hypothetical protein
MDAPKPPKAKRKRTVAVMVGQVDGVKQSEPEELAPSADVAETEASSERFATLFLVCFLGFR